MSLVCATQTFTLAYGYFSPIYVQRWTHTSLPSWFLDFLGVNYFTDFLMDLITYLIFLLGR